MNKTEKTILIIGIVVGVLMIIGVVGMPLLWTFYNSRVKDATKGTSCVVSLYDIVDGTMVTTDMLKYKKIDNVDTSIYECSSSLIVGKCVKKNTMVKRNEMFKHTDLIDCEDLYGE